MSFRASQRHGFRCRIVRICGAAGPTERLLSVDDSGPGVPGHHGPAQLQFGDDPESADDPAPVS